MPISEELRDVYLKFECPYCLVPVVHKGSWFKVISNFRCAGCAENVWSATRISSSFLNSRGETRSPKPRVKLWFLEGFQIGRKDELTNLSFS